MGGADQPKYALHFNGDAYVETPVTYDGSHPLTVEAWVTPTGLGTGHVFRNTSDKMPGIISMEVGTTEGFGQWKFLVAGDTKWLSWVRGGKVEPGKRVHVAGTFHRDQVAFYIDGECVGARQIPNIVADRTATMTLGGHRTAGTYFGRFHSARLSKSLRYEGNFTPAEHWPSDEQTMALYQFDEGQGDVLVDSSSNGHHGKIHGAKWVRGDE